MDGSHPGDDLEAGLLLLVDVQHRDDFAQQVGHFLRGALVLLLGPPESVIDVVGDFGEAAQCGDVRVLFELLRGDKQSDLVYVAWRRQMGSRPTQPARPTE